VPIGVVTGPFSATLCVRTESTARQGADCRLLHRGDAGVVGVPAIVTRGGDDSRDRLVTSGPSRRRG
jgi:hypothetical protein